MKSIARIKCYKIIKEIAIYLVKKYKGKQNKSRKKKGKKYTKWDMVATSIELKTWG